MLKKIASNYLAKEAGLQDLIEAGKKFYTDNKDTVDRIGIDLGGGTAGLLLNELIQRLSGKKPSALSRGGSFLGGIGLAELGQYGYKKLNEKSADELKAENEALTKVPRNDFLDTVTGNDIDKRIAENNKKIEYKGKQSSDERPKKESKTVRSEKDLMRLSKPKQKRDHFNSELRQTPENAVLTPISKNIKDLWRIVKQVRKRS
jgi:hypothetical protein